jgi:hypothetical protein
MKKRNPLRLIELFEVKGTMHMLVQFLSAHLDGVFSALYGILAAIVGWFVVQMIAKPVLRVREMRSDAIRLAERYAFFNSERDERVNEVRRELLDIASKLRAQARGQSWPLRCYCWL